MRVEERLVVEAPRQLVWDIVSDSDRQVGLFTGITRWTPTSEGRVGCGTRFAMRMRVRSAQVGGTIEMVEWDEPGDIAWTSITGVDHRGRWRLRELPGGRTLVSLRLSFQLPGGVLSLVADRLAAREITRNLRGTLETVRAVAEVEARQPGAGAGV